ncbi:MAG: pyrimidine/purine nucleoside phosphorylase [Nitrospirae bacterium]|nr:MAG: pyrimidine/purine nucleoside phosphorylase [Nitrospirota bacterium]
MSEFRGVTVVKKANIYFDGKVTSRTILFKDGSKKTLGVMLPGEYEFNTGDKEVMEIISGELDVLLPNEKNWKAVKGGESFDVPTNSKFKLKVRSLTDYCCSFIR